MKKTVFIGMSGGVDSSVAAGILIEQGYHVTGVHLHCWNIDGCADQDAEDARRVAETLGIPFYVFDFEEEYREQVVSYMVDGYKSGITPNPDVMCNNKIKFGLFFKRAMSMGADYVATGHYVKKRQNKLYIAKDKDKDQSYFLWTLTKNQIKHSLFPLGDKIKKTQVRNLAEKYKLPNAGKKDSQGVCFLGQISLPEFLSEFIPDKRGSILDTGGNILGTHQGAHHFTIGQRRGLGVGGLKTPQYVASKSIKDNTVVLSSEDNPGLLSEQIKVKNTNFIDKPKPSQRILARLRYRQPLFKATLSKLGKNYLLVPDRPQKFVAPGQSAVFYTPSNEMLGGGVIYSVE